MEDRRYGVSTSELRCEDVKVNTDKKLENDVYKLNRLFKENLKTIAKIVYTDNKMNGNLLKHLNSKTLRVVMASIYMSDLTKEQKLILVSDEAFYNIMPQPYVNIQEKSLQEQLEILNEIYNILPSFIESLENYGEIVLTMVDCYTKLVQDIHSKHKEIKLNSLLAENKNLDRRTLLWLLNNKKL